MPNFDSIVSITTFNLDIDTTLFFFSSRQYKSVNFQSITKHFIYSWASKNRSAHGCHERTEDSIKWPTCLILNLEEFHIFSINMTCTREISRPDKIIPLFVVNLYILRMKCFQHLNYSILEEKKKSRFCYIINKFKMKNSFI